MKSFEQFEYEQSPITEIVGVDVSKRFATNNKTTPSVKSTTTGARSPVTKSVQAPSIPTRAGRRSDGSKKSGIQATLDRNKERVKSVSNRTSKAIKSDKGQKALATLGGAVAGFAKYRPDKEDATTGTGAGTNMRALQGRLDSTKDGAISAYKAKKKEQDTRDFPRSKVTGADSEKSTSNPGFRQTVFNYAKRKAKDKVFGDNEEQGKTTGGRNITTSGGANVTDTEKSIKSGQEQKYRESQAKRKAERKAERDKKALKYLPKKQTGNETSKTPEQSKDSSALRKFAKSPDNKTVEKQIKTASKDTSAKSQVEKDSGQKIGNIVRSPGGKITTTGGEGGKTDSPIVKGAVKAAIKQSDKRKKSEAGADRLMAAMRAQGKKDDESGDKAITVKATSVPKKAGRPKGSTSGKRGRSATKASKGEQLRNKGDEIIKGLRDEKAKEVKEATNFIKAEQEAKAMGKRTMRTYAQMKKDKAKAAALKKIGVFEQKNELYSDWREEFIWETDKKYPDKNKEIKPMSGKNTIIVNPEDESAKYKRGY